MPGEKQSEKPTESEKSSISVMSEAFNIGFSVLIIIFVLAANWIGILPGVGSIGFFEKIGEETKFAPLFRSAYSDLNMTIALALIAVTLSHFFGIISIGFWAHVKKFINPK